MEESFSWGDAISSAWGSLTGVNNEGSSRVMRMLFFIIFLAGSGYAVYSYLEGQEVITLEQKMATNVSNQAQVDKARLDLLVQKVKMTDDLRKNSLSKVVVAQNSLQKYPFGEPRVGDGSVVVGPDITEPIVVVIDYPPDGIALRGIMIVGNQNVAVMDIPGVGTGMIVRVGDTFMQRKGRVARIAQDKVVINWGGKNWDIAPSF